MKATARFLVLGLALATWNVAAQDEPAPPEASPDSAAAAVPEDPDAFAAALEARHTDAVALTAAARSALAGERPLREGFVPLAQAPLDSLAWLTGRLDELDERVTARAAERRSELPRLAGELTPERLDELRSARAAALDAEAELDHAERELLLAAVDHLERHPALTRTALAEMRRDLRSRLAAAEAAFESADEAGKTERARAVVAAQLEIDRLETLLRGLRRHTVTGTPPPAPDADIELLADDATAENAKDRLGLLLPFLGDEAGAVVQSALARRAEKEAAAAAAAVPAPAADAGKAGRHAELTGQLGVAEKLLRDVREELDRRREQIADLEATLLQRYAESAEQAAEIAELPRTLDDQNPEGRGVRGPELYDDLRQLVDDLRDHVAEASRRRSEAELRLSEAGSAASDRTPAADPQGLDPEVLKRRRRVLDDRVAAAESLARLEEHHHDQVFILLKDAKRLRRDFARQAPEVRRHDPLVPVEELEAEAALTVPRVEALARHRWQTLQRLPSRWGDWGFLSDILAGSFWGLVILTAWWMLRRRVPRGVPGLLRFWAARSRHHVPHDLWSMRAPGERAVAALVDLVSIAVLLRLVRGAAPELGLLFLIWLQVALYRLILGLASLAFAAHPEMRPALATLQPEARQLALRTVRYAVLWLIASQFLRYVALEILAAVTLHEVLGLVFAVVLLPCLAVWALHRWEPYLREAVRRRDPVHPWVRIQTAQQFSVLRSLQGLAHLVLYAYLWLRDLAERLGGWGSLLLPWRQASDRDAVIEKPPVLPGDLMRQLLQRECPDEGFVERTDAHREIDLALERWRREKRRGVVIVLGEEGMGQRVFLDHWRRGFEAANGEAPVLRVRLGERLITEDDARSWLSSIFELDETPGDSVTLANRIRARFAGQVVIAEALQYAFLRRVDGFAALACLLSLVASTSDQLFWILAMHQPAWRYLDSLDGLVHTEVCQRVIPLEPFGEQELRQIVERRIAAAGYEVEFTRLLPKNVRRNPDPLAIERVTSEYFRRLAWASQGNPSVALRLWRETLAPGVGEGKLVASGYTQPSSLPPNLDDAHLFLLAAVHTQRSLTEDELAQVTNMSPSRVSSALKDLESERLLVTRSKRFNIEPRYLPGVVSDLKRRHFIHGSP